MLDPVSDGSVTSPPASPRARPTPGSSPTARPTSPARVRDELRHRRRVHQERRARGTGAVRRRSARRAAGSHPGRRDERSRRKRCTGSDGLAATRAMAQAAEQAAALPTRTALVLSTGVIGVPLPVAQIVDGLRQAAARSLPRGRRRGGPRYHDHRHAAEALRRALRDARRPGSRWGDRQGEPG